MYAGLSKLTSGCICCKLAQQNNTCVATTAVPGPLYVHIAALFLSAAGSTLAVRGEGRIDPGLYACTGPSLLA